MILSQLPTDNIYKFLFLSGLTIILFSILLFINQYNKIQTEHRTIDIEMIKQDVDYLKDSLTFEIEIERLATMQRNDSLALVGLKKLRKGELSNSNASRIRNQIDITLKTAFEMQKLFVEKKASFMLYSNMMEYRLKRQVSESKRLILFNFITLVGIITGLFLSFWGYNNWMNKIQIPMDQKLKRESEYVPAPHE